MVLSARLPITMLLVPNILLIGGCLSDPPRSNAHQTGGSLSEAVEKSRDNSTNRTIERRGDPNRIYSTYEVAPARELPVITQQSKQSETPSVVIATSRSSTDTAVKPETNDVNPKPFGSDACLTFAAFGYHMGTENRDFDHISGGGLSIGGNGEHVGGDVFIAGEAIEPRPTGRFAGGVRNVNGFTYGLNVRGYGVPPKLFPASPFVGLGISGGRMFWAYQNDLIDQDGNIIHNDSMGFFQLEAFAGVDIWRRKGFHLSGQLGGFFRSFDDVTDQGLKNDLIKDVGGWKLQIAAGGNF